MTPEGIAAIVASVVAVATGGKWFASKIGHLAVRAEKQDLLLFGDPRDPEGHPGLERWQGHNRRMLEEVVTRQDDLLRRVMRVELQVTPNGGNTAHLGDRVQRIETTLQTLIPVQRENADG